MKQFTSYKNSKLSLNVEDDAYISLYPQLVVISLDIVLVVFLKFFSCDILVPFIVNNLANISLSYGLKFWIEINFKGDKYKFF